MSILDEHELNDGEREAIADEPRPGVWLEEPLANEMRGYRGPQPDGRPLTQDETDCLIVYELTVKSFDAAMVADEAFGPWRRSVTIEEWGDVKSRRLRPAWSQRGGIHSDPLVRLLAYRAWGERDREWGNISASRASVIRDAVSMGAIGTADAARFQSPRTELPRPLVHLVVIRDAINAALREERPVDSLRQEYEYEVNRLRGRTIRTTE